MNRGIYVLKLVKHLAALVVVICAIGATTVQAAEVKIDIKPAVWELKPGLTTDVWTYNGTVPGTPIIVKEGERVKIDGINHLPVTTNIHWHGMVVPNDQDGPARVIKPGDKFHYDFVAKQAGTYWYNSHYRPVVTQVDMGLYAPFLVKSPIDDKYSGDHILMLDDWYLDKDGKRLSGTASGDMERYGNIETVNGKTGDAVKPLVFRHGQLQKLRFINASTAAFHTLKITGHIFRVTHTDGHPLPQPYTTDTITLAPAQRLDVEVAAIGKDGDKYQIVSDRPELGMNIPIEYKGSAVPEVTSPFVAPKVKAFPDIEARKPDYILNLDSETTGTMDNMHGDVNKSEVDKSSQMSTKAAGTSMHMDMPADDRTATTMNMQWSINGKVFPATQPLKVKVNQIVKIRLQNNDTKGMHPMDHPIHLHGTYFQVVSLNGKTPERETWRDTINVPAGEYVDIAFKMTQPGTWMLHCHVLDHEDGGMMTTIEATPAE